MSQQYRNIICYPKNKSEYIQKIKYNSPQKNSKGLQNGLASSKDNPLINSTALGINTTAHQILVSFYNFHLMST